MVAETWAGVIATEPVQQIFAITMGGFIIVLLVSISMFVLARGAARPARNGGSKDKEAPNEAPRRWRGNVGMPCPREGRRPLE